jgi:type IV fimbrial biogenesis protein FimT
MVVVSLLAVLGALALPGFDSLIERYRIRSASGDLTAAIYLARAEAIRRGGQVTLRRTSSPDCAPAESNEWSCGWLVFADTNDNGAHEPGEERIQAWPSPTGVKAAIPPGHTSGWTAGARWRVSAPSASPCGPRPARTTRHAHPSCA